MLRTLLPIVLPCAAWLRYYRWRSLRLDLVAALTVAVVAVPQGMAYALIAGLPVRYGLYGAIVPCMVASLWGSSAQLITGPSTALSLMVFGSLAGLAEPFGPEYVRLAITLSLMVGVIQIGLGLVRLGALVDFISHSVVIGFSAGAGVLTILKQLPNLLFDPAFAATLPAVRSTPAALWQVLSHLSAIHWPTLLLGLASMLIVIGTRRIWSPALGPAPGPLLALVVCGLLVWSGGGALVALNAKTTVAGGLFGWEGPIRVVGDLPSPPPPPPRPLLDDWTLFQDLFGAALGIALLGLMEAVAIAKAIASQTRQRLDSNQEFIGQGLGNLAGSLFSAYPVTASFTRSAVNHRTGAVTPLAGVLAGSLVMLTVLLLAGSAACLPIAALSGLLLVVAAGMVDRKALRLCLRATVADRAVVIVTFLATLLLHLEYAVFTGVGLSMILYLARTSRPTVRESAWDGAPGGGAAQEPFPACPQLPLLRVEGPLFFGSMNWVDEAFVRIWRNHPQARHLALRLNAVNHIDASGVQVLDHLLQRVTERGGRLFLLETPMNVLQVLNNAGLLERIGQDHLIHGPPGMALPRLAPLLDHRFCRSACPGPTFGTLCHTLRLQQEKETP